MKKLKKVFMSVGIIVAGLISKVSAVFDPDLLKTETKYGIFEPEPTIGEKITTIGKFAIPIILFMIGLFVILSEKITNKVKAIVVSVLVFLAILGYILMNYLSTKF